MRFDAGQHMRMEQRMKLSPRMIQSMEILQLPALALEERITQELEQNPLLELKESKALEPVAEESVGETPLVVGDASSTNSAAEFQRAGELYDHYGEDWSQNTQESAEYRPSRAPDGDRDAKMDAMANTADRAASLADQVLDQWRFVECEEPVRAAGEYLIGLLDDDGYIRTPWQEALKNEKNLNPQDIEAALRLLQTRVEPLGIGARNVSECMCIQLDALIEHDADEELKIARELILNYAHDIEQNRLPRVAQRGGWTIEQVKSGLLRLRKLDPYPGRRLAPPARQAIFPDVIVEFDPYHDTYVAAMARGRTPALRINPHYHKLSQDRSQEKTTRKYLATNMNNARWLIDAIRQRQNTLLRVVDVVLEQQRDFFDHGPHHLKPLPMILVAEMLSIHVGTVSRAVAEKYIQTPRGIYPLRMFFSGGTESASGEEMSWAAVQAKLKEVIESEDPSKPWSDDELVDQLKTRGLEIARRTIAKYRQQMNIPTARRRKRF